MRQEKLKIKIEKIGQINPLAMEAYDEIKERHDFISKEKNDLIEAKDSLLKTIEEIDKVAEMLKRSGTVRADVAEKFLSEIRE